MRAKLSKWRGEIGIRLPKEAIDYYHVKEGTEFEISIRDDGLLLKPMVPTEFIWEELVLPMPYKSYFHPSGREKKVGIETILW